MAASTPEGLQTKIALKAGSSTTFLFHSDSFLVVVFAVILFFKSTQGTYNFCVALFCTFSQFEIIGVIYKSLFKSITATKKS